MGFCVSLYHRYDTPVQLQKEIILTERRSISAPSTNLQHLRFLCSFESKLKSGKLEELIYNEYKYIHMDRPFWPPGAVYTSFAQHNIRYYNILFTTLPHYVDPV